MCYALRRKISHTRYLLQHRTEKVTRTTTKEPPKKKFRLRQLSSDSEDEPLPLQATYTKGILKRYKTEPEIDMDMCPLEWWKLHHGAYPVMATLAKKYMGSPATTVPCERLFSLSGNIVTKKRASVDPTTLNKILLLE
jgi:hypothetical protein